MQNTYSVHVSKRISHLGVVIGESHADPHAAPDQCPDSDEMDAVVHVARHAHKWDAHRLQQSSIENEQT